MNRANKPCLLGSETEYSVSVTTVGSHRRRQPETLAAAITQAIPREFRCLRDASFQDGVFLENGGRLYNDIHGHPEYCTPECLSPEQIAAYDKAGERILLRLAHRVKADSGTDITVTKNNLTPILPDTATYGNHESYLCWIELPRAATALIPHLVTRLPFAGSGCLSPHPGGWGFELSQRARHLVCEMGPDTTSNRAIFCTRVRKMTDASANGWTRCHLIAKDSQRSPWGIYLTFGTTGLLFWILNHGGKIGEGLALTHPVVALRTVSLDPWLRTPLPMKNGRSLTAIEIQREYLQQCEEFAEHHELPEWGPRVLRHWRQVLDTLERNPFELATRLDAYAKLLILQHEVRRAGVEWQQVRAAAQLLDQLRRTASHESLIRAVVTESAAGRTSQFREGYAALNELVRAAGPQALEHLRFLLRLQVLDLKYHELGGLYDQMAETGACENVVLTSQDVEQAVVTPPSGGRAAVRGSLVKKYSESHDWCADWSFLMHLRTGEYIDLRDPFLIEADAPSLEKTARPRDPAWNVFSRLMR